MNWGWSHTPHGEDWSIYSCPICGAAVIDDDYYSTNRDLHEEWHKKNEY